MANPADVPAITDDGGAAAGVAEGAAGIGPEPGPGTGQGQQGLDHALQVVEIRRPLRLAPLLGGIRTAGDRGDTGGLDRAVLAAVEHPAQLEQAHAALLARLDA